MIDDARQDSSDTYIIRTYEENTAYALFFPSSMRVTFFANGTDVPLPNPRLLEVHAAIARVLHASGSAEYIDKVLRDREDIRCLATDGSTDIAAMLLAF